MNDFLLIVKRYSKKLLWNSSLEPNDILKIGFALRAFSVSVNFFSTITLPRFPIYREVLCC